VRHLKFIAIALTAALALALVGGLAACGSDEPNGDGSPTADSTTTYRNDEYGFSMTYAESYEQLQYEVGNTGGASSVFRVGFFDTEGTMVDGQPVDGLAVSVYDLRSEVAPEEVPQLEEEFQAVLSSMLSGFENAAVVDPLEAVEINGVPGFKFSYTYTSDGTAMRASTFFLVKGQYEYQLTAQASMDRWEEVSPELEAAAMSFTVD
jgi:hypothetical protein